jgi:RimJ/RimL family protein N-acetyltransferase
MIETPRGTVTIRLSTPDDADLYRALRLKALQDHPEVFGADYESNLSYTSEFWRQRLTPSQTAANYVADVGGELVGMTVVRRDEGAKVQHNGGIFSVYIHPDWRGMGIMDGLLTACIDWAREHEILILKLSVTSVNTAAIRVYLRHGFSVYGVDPMVIYAHGRYYDELLMSMRL